jgi:protocatechuate 3,4-dioxygenase beta subunit
MFAGRGKEAAVKRVRLFFGLLCTVVATGGLSALALAEGGPSKVVVAPVGEPGERLVVSGTVFKTDGRTPVPGARVYVYQTDVNGYYRPGANDSKNPRLKGTMVTGPSGQYEFRTIKPGPYPGGGVPAHIHYVVNAPGHRERVFEIVFEGDPALTDRIKEDAKKDDCAFCIRPLARGPDGAWQVVQDIRLPPSLP